MQQVHIGIAGFAGSLPLFAAPSASICILEAAMSVLSSLRTSLLDLAGHHARPFFYVMAERRPCRKVRSASDPARAMARRYSGRAAALFPLRARKSARVAWKGW